MNHVIIVKWKKTGKSREEPDNPRKKVIMRFIKKFFSR